MTKIGKYQRQKDRKIANSIKKMYNNASDIQRANYFAPIEEQNEVYTSYNSDGVIKDNGIENRI